MRVPIGQNCWGPQQPGDACFFGVAESAGRAMLTFHDATGRQTGRFVFPNNPPDVPPVFPFEESVLIATQDFVDLTGLAADFILPHPELIPNSGKVCFRGNPDNPNRFDVALCLSYGDFTGDTEGAGLPASALPVLDSSSLKRFQNFFFGSNNNADFQLDSIPDPTNAAGTTFTAFPAATQAEQGEVLFLEETFNGNTRTCGSCHVPDDDFGLSPATIATTPAADPLFIAEQNIDLITMTFRTQPSDLRGIITANTGATTTILAGTEDVYFVIGGSAISNATTLTDEDGNSGTLQTFTAGDIDGLENSARMRGGRGLILENVDGFTRTAVFRTSPHLLNIQLSGPFGFSPPFGGADNLNDFAVGAVRQHFPRTLDRVDGLDFRIPITAEPDAMTAFQETIFNPTDQIFNLNRFATTEAQKRGRLLFFGASKCSRCHSGPVLAEADGSIPGTTLGVNEDFNTGVANQPINGPGQDNLPTEPAGLPFGTSTREFSTPQLFGAKDTAPFFHDNSVATLEDAVEFYDTLQFTVSPGGIAVGGIQNLTPSNIKDLVAFLESLVEIPFDKTPTSINFGDQPVSGGPTTSRPITLTNTSTEPLTITGVTLKGSDPADYQITQIPSATPFGLGQKQVIRVVFDPTTGEELTATLEITVTDTNDSWAVGVALRGTGREPEITIVPTSLAFGNQDIDNGPTVTQTVIITNDGTANLFSTVQLTGTNPGQFSLVDSGDTTLTPGNRRTLRVTFNPSSVGVKAALIRVTSNDADEGVVDIPLSGTGVDQEIDVSPLTLTFGNHDVDTGPTTAKVITITNEGTGLLSFTSPISLTSLNADQFQISSDTGQASLAPAAQRILQITFDPSTTGTKSAKVTIQSDDSSEPTVEVDLSGTGVAPEITIVPLTLTFANQGVDDGPTAAKVITITNEGTTPLNFTSPISLTGLNANQFEISSDTGQASLAPAAQRILEITFDPSTAGAKSAKVTIESNDTSEATVEVDLSGTGLVPDITVTPLNLNFAQQGVGAGATVAQSVVITNEGAANLTISGVTLLGANSDQFAISSDTGEGTLTPGNKRTVQVVFNPSSIGVKTAQLRITSSDGAVDVSLNGQGTDDGSPVPGSLAKPADGSTLNDNTVAFDWADATDMESGLAYYSLVISGTTPFTLAVAATEAVTTTTSDYVANDLPDGDYNWTVVAVDQANNKQPYNQVFSFRIVGKQNIYLPLIVK